MYRSKTVALIFMCLRCNEKKNIAQLQKVFLQFEIETNIFECSNFRFRLLFTEEGKIVIARGGDISQDRDAKYFSTQP